MTRRNVPDLPDAATAGRALDALALARAGASVAGTLPAAQLPRLAASVVSVDAPARFRWLGSIDRQGYAGGTLDLSVKVTLCCDLCDAPMPQSIVSQRPFRFVASEAELVRTPLVAEDDIEWLVGSPSFDLADLIDQEAVLALPLSPRHQACQAALDERAPPDGAAPSALAAALGRLKSVPH